MEWRVLCGQLDTMTIETVQMFHMWSAEHVITLVYLESWINDSAGKYCFALGHN